MTRPPTPRTVIPGDYVPAPDLLRDRVILVSGAGGALGSACARTFAAHGATVVLCSRRVPPLTALYDEIVTSGAPEPAICPLDFTKAGLDQFREVAEKIEQELGKLEGLVHCAGRLVQLAPIELYDPAEWLQCVHVNLNATFLLTQVCLPLLRRSQDARIVFTSADVGREARAYWGAYAASKFGIEALMQSLAAELEEEGRVRVNSFDPGPMRSRLRQAAFPAAPPESARDPEHAARALLYLAGPDSRALHGLALQAP